MDDFVRRPYTAAMAPARTVFSLLLLFPLLAWLAPAGAQPAPKAVEGRIVLPANLQEPVALDGQWGFAWQQFVDPQWEQPPTGAFVQVPASWNDVTVDGKPRGENGWGSYLLRVDCPRGESLALEAPGQRTAGRLFVNGTLVTAHGAPGPTPATNWAAVYNRVPITQEFACPLRITLHVANFDHRAGGFVRPITAGPQDLLELRRESRIVRATVLLSAYLFTGLVSLIFFAVRPRERVPLVYGLFCIAMALYTDLIGERLFLRALPPQISWFAYMRVEYLSWIGAMGLFFLTLRGLFPVEIHRRAVEGVMLGLCLGTAAVLALPPAVYSYVVVPGQTIAVLVSGYVAVAMLRAEARNRVDARVLLAGMLTVLVTLGIDLLLIDTPRPDRKFATLGFALFMLSPAVVIARRLSQALNAEARSRTLEENARLREDVERMSRHDLKTPLNSVLGVARLLRDDPRLASDQQELVGVLQRGGLRMLEMVSQSLGLFRIETGSYVFRPQSVDLREKVSRVLVDLHSNAEASRVTLNWQDSEPGPALVRAEPLLCYSVIANVVKNAIEAAGPGNQVTLALLRGDPVALTVHNPGEVDPEVASRFFEKYVTGRSSAGTGLGTYSARMMARAQNGDLQMRTGPDGTTLTLTLPQAKDAPPQPHPDAPADDRAVQWMRALPERHVLLVDDDEFTRLVTRRLLPSPPFRVETAANGQAAIEAMVQRSPDYLLVDLEMPLRNGLETVRWLRAQEALQGRPRCRVIMVSGSDEETSAVRALAAGADLFLAKPVSRERLLSAMRTLEGGPVQEAAAPDASPAAASPESGLPLAPRAADEQVVIDPEWAEVFPGFLKKQQEAAEAMNRALAAGDRDGLQFLAHRAFGALSAMQLHWAARQTRSLERTAPHAPLQDLKDRVQALQQHLARVRVEYRAQGGA